MSNKKLAGYLINRETGIMIGVNQFGLSVAQGYKDGKSVSEIAGMYRRRKDYPLGVLEEMISKFVDQMKDRGFERTKINIISLKERSVPPLLTVQLDLSWDCNLRCRHCYLVNTKLIDKPLTKKEWQDIIDQVYKMQVPRIAFLGGEPLVSPIFFDLAEYAFRYGLKLYTTTNAVLVTSKIAKRLLQVGFNEIDVSLDGATTESHEFLRGEGTFDKTIKGISNLVASGLRVKSATVLSKKNLNEIWDLMKLGQDLGLYHMYFNTMIPIGSEKDFLKRYELCGEDWIFAKEIVRKWNAGHKQPKVFAENWFIFGDLSGRKLETLKDFDYAGCRAGKRELIITPDGFIAACPLLSTKREFQTMNIRRNSLEEIWQKDEWITRLRQVNESTIQGKCKSCFLKIVCKGGCHVLALFECGNINQPDPRCPLTN